MTMEPHTTVASIRNGRCAWTIDIGWAIKLFQLVCSAEDSPIEIAWPMRAQFSQVVWHQLLNKDAEVPCQILDHRSNRIIELAAFLDRHGIPPTLDSAPLHPSIELLKSPTRETHRQLLRNSRERLPFDIPVLHLVNAFLKSAPADRPSVADAGTRPDLESYGEIPDNVRDLNPRQLAFFQLWAFGLPRPAGNLRGWSEHSAAFKKQSREQGYPTLDIPSIMRTPPDLIEWLEHQQERFQTRAPRTARHTRSYARIERDYRRSPYTAHFEADCLRLREVLWLGRDTFQLFRGDPCFRIPRSGPRTPIEAFQQVNDLLRELTEFLRSCEKPVGQTRRSRRADKSGPTPELYREIAQRTDCDLERKMQEILKKSNDARIWTSQQWAEVLGVTAGRIRQTQCWKDLQKKKKGLD